MTPPACPGAPGNAQIQCQGLELHTSYSLWLGGVVLAT